MFNFNSKRRRYVPQAAAKQLYVFEQGSLVRITNLESEPSMMDYHKRNKWLVSNLIGRVLRSTPDELEVINLRTGRHSSISPLMRLTVFKVSEENASNYSTLVRPEYLNSNVSETSLIASTSV